MLRNFWTRHRSERWASARSRGRTHELGDRLSPLLVRWPLSFLGMAIRMVLRGASITLLLVRPHATALRRIECRSL